MGDASAAGTENLLLQPTDGQVAPGQGDLAGHGNVLAGGNAGQSADDAGEHRPARAGAFLRDAARRNVNMDLRLVNALLRNAEAVTVGLGVSQGGAGRLLHHVAQLPGEQHAAPRRDAGLDEQDVAADWRVEHARRHAHHVLTVLVLGHVAGLPQVAVQLLVGHLGALDLAARHAPGHLPCHRADLALQIANPSLASVVGNQLLQRRVGDGDLVGLQAVLVQLARQQVTLGDLQLLLLDVTGKINHFHAVHQRCRNLLGVVGRRDEHHFAQIKRNAQVVIGEVRVLCGVQHFQQRRTGVALKAAAQLVHLVEQHHRVLGARRAQPLDDPPRHRADVGAAVTANVGLVARAAQGDPHILAAQALGDALRDGGLAHAGRPGEHQDRPLVHLGGVDLAALGPLLAQPANGQEFQHPVLDLIQTVVVVVQNGRRRSDIELIVRPHVPRQLGDGGQVGSDDRSLGGVGVHAAQAVQLAVDFLLDVTVQAQRLNLAAQLLGLVGLAVLAAVQLLLDDLHLLAQVVFALIAVDLFLDLGADLLLHIQHFSLAVEQGEHLADALGDLSQLQYGLLVFQPEVHVKRNKVGHLAHVFLALDGLHRLARQELAARNERLELLVQLTGQRCQLDGLARLTADQRNVGPQELGAGVIARLGAANGAHQHLHRAVGILADTQHIAQRTHVVQILALGIVHVLVTLRDDQYYFLFKHGRVDGRDAQGAAGVDVLHHGRVDHAAAHRADRDVGRNGGGVSGIRHAWLLVALCVTVLCTDTVPGDALAENTVFGIRKEVSVPR